MDGFAGTTATCARSATTIFRWLNHFSTRAALPRPRAWKRRIAHDVRKALESAIANAENNHQLDVDRLVVTRAEVGKSIVMRRFQARGRGRASRIEKWFSHLKIVVAERAAVEEAPRTPRGTTPAPSGTEQKAA